MCAAFRKTVCCSEIAVDCFVAARRCFVYMGIPVEIQYNISEFHLPLAQATVKPVTSDVSDKSIEMRRGNHTLL